MGHRESIEDGLVFLQEGGAGVMFFLVADVTNYRGQLGVRVGKSAESFLPFKSTHDPVLGIDIIRRSRLYLADQSGQGKVGFQANQQMEMIGHVINGDELGTYMGDNARHVFLQFDLVLGTDEVLTALDSEYNVDIDLCVGICHNRIEERSSSDFKPFRMGVVSPGDAAPDAGIF